MQAVRAALAALSLAWASSAAAQTPATTPPVVLVAEFDGIVQPVSAEFITSVIDRADTSGAALVVITLRTPGGLLDSTQSIVSRMITSRAPVVMFVTPSGARAASAGFILMIAADIAAMAPGTHIGAAHPVSGSGESLDDTMSKKAAADVAAYARSLAEARGRNVALAEQAVTESRAFTDREATDAKPPIVDVIAADVDDLLRQLHGRTIKRFDGRTVTLSTQGAEQQRIEMTWRQRFLGAIAHPQIASLLLTLGLLGLTVEIWNPGSIAPGVVGGLCLLLAFFAHQVIPVDISGLLLIAFGIGLLILELKVPSFGMLGIGGTVSLVVGAVMVPGNVPGVRLNYSYIVPVAVAFAVIFLALGRLALKAQRIPPVTGADGMLQMLGRTLTAVPSPGTGQVLVHGEIWRATSDAPLAADTSVRVKAVDGLTLLVEADGSPPREGGPG
jgi:membrane-bound serine protease (ClpP class)